MYDHAGIGWSDASLVQRTPAAIAAELRVLLVNAGMPDPYILVGASVGEKYIRLYAEQYPQQVVGLVLVDACNESVDTALTIEEQADGLAGAQRNGQRQWCAAAWKVWYVNIAGPQTHWRS